jgi:hypothetical protein
VSRLIAVGSQSATNGTSAPSASSGGQHRDHDPTGQLLPDRRPPMRRARQRFSRYHLLHHRLPVRRRQDRTGHRRFSGDHYVDHERTSWPTSHSTNPQQPCAETIGPPSFACTPPRLWHADLGPFGTARGARCRTICFSLNVSAGPNCRLSPQTNKNALPQFLGVTWSQVATGSRPPRGSTGGSTIRPTYPCGACVPGRVSR